MLSEVRCAVELWAYLVHRLFLPHRAYRIFPCVQRRELGLLFRTNNYIESMHNVLKNTMLKYVIDCEGGELVS